MESHKVSCLGKGAVMKCETCRFWEPEWAGDGFGYCKRVRHKKEGVVSIGKFHPQFHKDFGCIHHSAKTQWTKEPPEWATRERGPFDSTRGWVIYRGKRYVVCPMEGPAVGSIEFLTAELREQIPIEYVDWFGPEITPPDEPEV